VTAGLLSGTGGGALFASTLFLISGGSGGIVSSSSGGLLASFLSFASVLCLLASSFFISDNSSGISCTSSIRNDTSASYTTDGSQDLVFCKIIDTETKRVDASSVVLGVITGVTGASWVADFTGCKCAGLVGEQWVATNSGNLFGKLGSNLLVELLSTIACRILMLLQSGDLGVDGLDGFAGYRCKTNGSGVALQGAEDEGKGHAINITSFLSVGESLVSGGLLETVCIHQSCWLI
jgi:hypothetical protein